MLLCVVVLSVSAAFAVDDDAALSGVSDGIAINEDVLKVSDDSDSVIAIDEENIVTKDTFFNYFDESGTLLDNVTSDELIFEGDFSDVGVNYITIDAPIKFTGNGALFDGVSFVIYSDNVVVDGFTVTQTADVSAFTASGVSNVTLSNNVIDYTALEGCDSYAVYAKLVDNFNLIDNTIFYVGNTDGTTVNNAVRIEGDDEDDSVPATGIVVSGNTFNVQMPSVDVGYDPDTWASTIMNDAIVFYYVEDLKFVGNDVKVYYNDVSTAYGWDSMYAVSVRSDAYTFGEVQSKDVVIANNTIDIAGHSCVYPFYVCADKFAVSGNNITSSSETYLAHGIDVDGPSAVGDVSDNIIIVEAPIAAYGIYSYQYMGSIEGIYYCDNVIDVTGYGSAGMEIVECNPIISGNEITANGNYTYGIIASIRDEGIISDNTIIVLGSNIGADATGDGLMPKNSMGISVKGDCLIEDNVVDSTNIGINFVEEGGSTIADNTITVENNALVDSYGIYAKSTDDLTFINNVISYVGYSNGTIVNNAVCIEGNDKKFVPIKNIKFEGNTFDISIPSCDVGYDETTWEPAVYSEGIVFYYVEDVEFVNNTVDIVYNDVLGSYNYDSLYAVSVKGNPYIYDEDVVSKNVVIADNEINIVGHGCAYAVFVGAENLTVSGNDIFSSSEAYLAHGIDIDSNAVGVIVDSNNIVAEAPLATYGICADGYMGPVTESEFINNNVTVTGYSSIGFKVVVDPNPYIAGNIVYANGNYTYGIIANDGVVQGNTVYALGSNTGSDPTGDSYMKKNSVGISVKATDVVENTVYSTNVGLNIVQEGGINVEGNTITVENNALIDSYGIYAASVDDLTFTDNVISYVGNTNGTYINNAVRIEGNDKDDKTAAAKHIVFEGNTFDITLSSVDVSYGPHWEAIYPSEGIVFYYCEDVQFVDNYVTVDYAGHTSAYGYYDSIYAVSVRSDAYASDEIQSNNVVIANNTIITNGYGCVYGVTVEADEFEVSGNTITTTADAYLAHGIDVNGPSSNGDVFDNTIVAEAPLASYGIYSYPMNGAIDAVNFMNNTITVSGYVAAGMELAQTNPIATDNTVTANGNYTYGIIGSVRGGEGLIVRNTVNALGSNIGADKPGDSFMTKNSVGIAVRGTALIENNTIESTDIGIDSVDIGEFTINNNNIIVNSNTEDIDNHAIVAKDIEGYLAITNNNITYVGATTPKENYTAAKAYAVYILNATASIVNNTFDITVPSIPADWEEVPPGSWNYVRHSYSEGIVLEECVSSELIGNDITFNYNDGSYGSLYVIDVLDSNNILIKENNITANGENYLHAMILQGDDLIVSDNTIVAESGYYANGIDVEGPSTAVIESNRIVAIAPEDSYPIYAGMNSQPISLEITGNNISGMAYYVVGVEIAGEDIEIEDNYIYVKGNHTIAIGAYVDDLTVNNNEIVSEASNVGDIPIWDSMGTNTTGIKSLKGNVNITENSIETTGEYAVDIADCEGNVNDNYLVSELNYGDRSVNYEGGADVYNNIPIETILAADDISVAYGEDAILIANLTNGFTGKVISGAKVVAKINGVKYAAKTKNGRAVFNITGLEIGSYDAVLAYGGNSKYLKSRTTANIEVTKIPTVISADDISVAYIEDAILVANLTNGVTGNVISGANVALTINGEKYTAKTKNGQAVFNLTGLEIGSYDAVLAYGGNSEYLKSSTTVNVEVTKIPTVISADDISVSYVEDVILVVNLTNGVTGNVISGANVVAKINGVKYTAKTKNGQAVFNLTGLEMGRYDVALAYGGNSKYLKSTTHVNVEVTKIPTLVSADDISVSYVEDAILVATLTNCVTGNVISGANIVLVINGEKYTAKTKNGQAVFNLTGLEMGSYDAVVSYGGNSKYLKSSVHVTVEITKIPTVLSVKDVTLGEDLVATLTNNDTGQLISGANVVAKINGVKYTAKTKNGQAMFSTSDLAPGNYTASISYSGNSKYIGSTATANITKD